MLKTTLCFLSAALLASAAYLEGYTSPSNGVEGSDAIAEFLPEDSPAFPETLENLPTLPRDPENLPTLPRDPENLPTLPRDPENLPSLPRDPENLPTLPRDPENLPTLPRDPENLPSFPDESENLPSFPEDPEPTEEPTAEPSPSPEQPIIEPSKTYLSTISSGYPSFWNSSISGSSTQCDDLCEASTSSESCTLSTQGDGKVVTICDCSCETLEPGKVVSTLTSINGNTVTVTVCDEAYQTANPNGDYSVITKIDKSVVTITVELEGQKGPATPAATSTSYKPSSILPYEGSASTKSFFMILCSIPVFVMIF